MFFVCNWDANFYNWRNIINKKVIKQKIGGEKEKMDIIWWTVIGIGMIWILIASIKMRTIDWFEETAPQEKQGVIKEIFFIITVAPYLISFGIIYLSIVAIEKITQCCN